MPPSWLERILDDNSHYNLEHVEGRNVIAARILSALPRDVIANAVKTTVVLKALASVAIPATFDDVAEAITLAVIAAITGELIS